jgi:signal transduction histidine kinase
MVTRTAGRIAWSLFAASAALSAAAVALSFATGHDELGAVAVALIAGIPFPGIGALIASRFPRNPIGWIFVAVGLFQAVETSSYQYGYYGLITDPGSLPLAGLAAWLSFWTWMPSLALLLTFLLLLFPDGRLPSARWRWAAWGAGAGIVLLLLGVGAGAAGIRPAELITEDIQGFSPAATITAAAGAVLVLVSAIASVVALIVRFRRSRGEEREQLKWMAFAGSLAFVGVAIQFTPASTAGGWFGFVVTNLIVVGILAVPVAAGIAILKYRLYAIDVVINKTVVFGLLAAFIAAVYVAIVVGVGALVGGTGNVVLSAIAAAVVAIAFQPVRRRAQRLANRLVYGRRATPYEVLSSLSDRLSESYSVDAVLPEMAAVIGEGMGASGARVWLAVGADLRPVAAWPANGVVQPPVHGHEALPDRAFEVRHRGEVLGAITVAMPPGEPLSGAQEKLMADVAAQAGLVLRNVRLVEELRESRRRIVAAQDERARKLERDLHDGAQQQLVALAVKQRLAASLVGSDGDRLRSLLEDLQAEAGEALETLRDLARGIYPPLLADRGLAEALGAQARKASIPVSLESSAIGRYPQEIESTAYFCCLEALANVAKYADASGAEIRLSARGDELVFEVIDDGRGFDPTAIRRGSGLQGMADRLDAIGGTLDVRSEIGVGTTVTGRLPVRAG